MDGSGDGAKPEKRCLLQDEKFGLDIRLFGSGTGARRSASRQVPIYDDPPLTHRRASRHSILAPSFHVPRINALRL
jgi:hypothetical protein